MWSYILSVIHSSWVYMKTMYTTSIQFGSRKTDIRFFLVKRKTLCLCCFSSSCPLSPTYTLWYCCCVWVPPVNYLTLKLRCIPKHIRGLPVEGWFLAQDPLGVATSPRFSRPSFSAQQLDCFSHWRWSFSGGCDGASNWNAGPWFWEKWVSWTGYIYIYIFIYIYILYVYLRKKGFYQHKFSGSHHKL